MKYISLKWKVTALVASGALIFGTMTMVMIAWRGSDLIENELINRGTTIALSLARPASEYVIEKDQVSLKNMALDAMTFQSVAYVLIEDDERSILSDTYNGNVPKELMNFNTFASENTFSSQLVNIPEKGQYYDILVPIEDGLVGFVRVGMDKKFVDDIVYENIYISLIIVFAALILAIIISFFLANRITKPVIYLTKAADKISLGDFDTEIIVKSNDEIGDLGNSIDRMRESLKAAIDRLRKRQKMKI
jgi:HAMP domain-containing protein